MRERERERNKDEKQKDLKTDGYSVMEGQFKMGERQAATNRERYRKRRI